MPRHNSETSDDALQRQRALSRWDSEGGAGPVATAPSDKDQIPTSEMSNADLVALRVRVIALENLVISLLGARPLYRVGGGLPQERRGRERPERGGPALRRRWPGDAETDVGADGIAKATDNRWRFGANSRSSRTAGSLHCDLWTGPGAELAARRTLAVYPVSGWWKTRAPKRRYNSEARYALIMTLKSLEEDIDLHAEIEAATTLRISQDIDV